MLAVKANSWTPTYKIKHSSLFSLPLQSGIVSYLIYFLNVQPHEDYIIIWWLVITSLPESKRKFLSQSPGGFLSKGGEGRDLTPINRCGKEVFCQLILQTGSREQKQHWKAISSNSPSGPNLLIQKKVRFSLLVAQTNIVLK